MKLLVVMNVHTLDFLLSSLMPSWNGMGGSFATSRATTTDSQIEWSDSENMCNYLFI